MKYVIVVIPGMADLPLTALGGRTPLEAASTPHLDRLAARGRFGTVQIVPDDAPQGSVIGLPALMGYDPLQWTLKRGPLEAAGMGIAVGRDDLVMRLNFISTFRGTMADTRAGHIADREAQVLLESLRSIKTPLDLSIHIGLGYRHLMVVHGGAPLEVGTIPPQEVLGHPLRDFYPFGRDAQPFARFLDDSAAILAPHDINRVRVDLGENPADAVWLWGEGIDQDLPTVGSRLGLKSAMVAAAPLVRGLAIKAGLFCPTIPGATGDRDTDLPAKLKAALDELSRNDLVYVHVAAVNEASRAGDADGKVRDLEGIDRELIGSLLSWVEEKDRERRILVTSDHQTLVHPEKKSDEPVPFAMFGAGIEGVRSRPFTEKAARSADLKLPDARAMLDFFFGTKGRGYAAGR